MRTLALAPTASALALLPAITTSRLATTTPPELGLSSPATSLRMVLLPQPLGPTSATKSPCGITRSVCASASVPPPYCSVTLLSSIKRSDMRAPCHNRQRIHPNQRGNRPATRGALMFSAS